MEDSCGRVLGGGGLIRSWRCKQVPPRKGAQGSRGKERHTKTPPRVGIGKTAASMPGQGHMGAEADGPGVEVVRAQSSSAGTCTGRRWESVELEQRRAFLGREWGLHRR